MPFDRVSETDVCETSRLDRRGDLRLDAESQHRHRQRWGVGKPSAHQRGYVELFEWGARELTTTVLGEASFVLLASSLDELVALGTLPARAARFLEAAVAAGLNILVAGATSQDI